MDAKKYYRRYIEKAIEENPTTIELIRTERVLIDEELDEYEDITHTLDPQTVTFYNRKAQREIMQNKGQVVGYMASNIEKILCAHDADILKDDRFTANNREYRVAFVNNYRNICKIAELEVLQE